MSTPIADHLRATADRLADLARDGATPAQITAYAASLGLMALKVARLERTLDEIVADAMADEQQRHRHERHQAIIDSLLATRRCHLAQRRPGHG